MPEDDRDHMRVDLDTEVPEDPWRVPYRVELPGTMQVASALAMLALVRPAALGGMPVLPVTIYDDRRRQQEQIVQESSSTVGIYQDSQAAEVALTLSQRRLASATRDVERLTSHDVTEQDVVRAARRVLAGEGSARQGARFRSALGRVANDSVDLFILRDDEAYEQALDPDVDELPDLDDDPDAWDPYRFD